MTATVEVTTHYSYTATAATAMSQPLPCDMAKGESEETYEVFLIDLIHEYENLLKVTSTKLSKDASCRFEMKSICCRQRASVATT